MIDIIKEYLISVGVKVDTKSIDASTKQMSDFEKLLGASATSIAGRFAVATAGLTAFYATATVVMGGVAKSVAMADREVEILARRFYTTEANARSLSTAMKTLGINSIEQLKDVALNPEMRGQFMELRELSRSLENPESQKYLQYIREINFEFQKLAVRVQYFTNDVMASFAMELQPTIEALRTELQPVFDDFVKNMPKLAQSVGRFLANIVQIGIHVGQAWSNVFAFINGLPDVIKRTGLALGGLFLLLKSSPLGWVLATLQAIFLLIDDFAVYMKGGKSYYSEAYDFLTGKKKEGQSNALEDIQKDFKEGGVGGVLGGAGKRIKQKFSGYTPAGKVTNIKAGEDFGNISTKRVGITEPIFDFLVELNKALNGASKSDYVVTEGYADRGSPLTGHASGFKFDMSFKNKNFQERLNLLKAISQQKGLAESFIEVQSQEQYNQYMQGLNGYNTSKFRYKQTGAGNEHVDVRVAPIQLTQNIHGNDPKATANEAVRAIASAGIRTVQGAIV